MKCPYCGSNQTKRIHKSLFTISLYFIFAGALIPVIGTFFLLPIGIIMLMKYAITDKKTTVSRQMKCQDCGRHFTR
ncbi:hypothetical protein HZY91_01540 [Facklamia sp. DSM 111018]|uniref:LITAF domain-containing protein n=1 Tax=Facklamia lactis TaxID=2749967 RepID=A0ABS0LNL5_9LACT|nr:hypothetical protein [Facklamia lactis]MBG9985572.1 hypothetical protein [Facklamia lactis]